MTAPDAGFLRAVCESPLDDTPRLVYADWLDEHGDGARAELIRVQCELATLRAAGCHEGKTCNVTGPCDECRRDVLAERLRRRERDLLYECGLFWAGSVAVALAMYDWHQEGGFNGDDGRSWQFRRGFVESVTLSCADFMEHARPLFAVAPVLEVRLSDRRPDHHYTQSPEWNWWWDPVPSWVRPSITFASLPRLLWSRLPRPSNLQYATYPSAEAACAALSAACVSYGREVAGLPPLPEIP